MVRHGATETGFISRTRSTQSRGSNQVSGWFYKSRAVPNQVKLIEIHGSAQRGATFKTGLRQFHVQHGAARHFTARHRTARHGTARHGTARHGTARHGTARHGTACLWYVYPAS